MANQIPFTVYASIPTTQLDKRRERGYELDMIAGKVYRDLAENFDGNITTPGGNGNTLSVFPNIVAVRPGFGQDAARPAALTGELANAFGNARGASNEAFGSAVTITHNDGVIDDKNAGLARITIVGFTEGDIADPYGTITMAHDNGYVTGKATGAPGWTSESQPTAASRAAVKALKSAIEEAVTTVTITIVAIEINGVRYGNGGYTFPA